MRVCQGKKERPLMSQEGLYQWIKDIGRIFGKLGYGQLAGLALYSYRVMLARHSAPGREAAQLVWEGKARTVRRRLERWIANERMHWGACCRVGSAFVLRHYVGECLLLWVDETQLGKHLSVMVVGLAYRGCCIPLAFWRCAPEAWPMGQVALMEELLTWIAEGVPEGCVPLLMAERGIGTSPDVIRVVAALGWQYRFRVQGQTRFQVPNGRSVALHDLVPPGGRWSAQGRAFKKAGWLPLIAHVLWEAPYAQPRCLVTNCPAIAGRLYAQHYWQEASFRDLKSADWQWQAAHILTPANLLVLVLGLAYAFVLSLGTLAFEEPSVAPQVLDKRYSVFRHGLRLWQACFGQPPCLFDGLAPSFLCFPGSPLP